MQSNPPSSGSGVYEFKCNKVMFGELHGEALLPLRCVNNRIHMKLQCQRPNGLLVIPERYNLSVGHSDVQQILVYFGHVPSFVAIETSTRFAEVICKRIGCDILVPASKKELKKKYIILALESAFKLDTEASLELSQLMSCLKPWAKVKILNLEAAQKLIADANLDVAQKELCYNKKTKPNGLVETVLVYQPMWVSGDIPLTSDDITCLAEGSNMKDVIINFYLKYVYDSILTPRQRQKTYIFNTYFYKRLMKKQGKKFLPDQMHGMVRRWTQNVDIFEKDFLVIPVNENSHWYVVIICFPSKAFISEENEKHEQHEKDKKEEESADFVKETSTEESLPNKSSCISPNTLNISTNENSDIPDKENASNSTTEDHLDFYAHCSHGSSTITKNSTNDGTMLSSSAEKEVVNGRKQAFSANELVQPCILIFDSSPGTSHPQVFANVRHYLTQEWALRKQDKPPRVYDKSNMKGCYPKVPQSINDYDSGVFLLQYVESFFTRCIKSFVIPIQLQSWFTLDYVFKKRKHISDLITRLSASVGKRNHANNENEMWKRSRLSAEL